MIDIPNDNAILCRLLSIKLTEAAKNLLLSEDKVCKKDDVMALPRLFRPFHSAHGQYSHELVSLCYKSELGERILEQEKGVLDQLLP